MIVEYHPGKVNVVADALSKKSGTIRLLFAQSKLGDSDLRMVAEEIGKGLKSNYHIKAYGILLGEGRICVPNTLELKQAILEEPHSSTYAMHLGSTKMYRTLKKSYWWSSMKREIAEYVDRCLLCQ
ncbi:uncharacterized protein LOC120089164 [Benincasa hispida]|uniref:uncharacterized protein LOC120089164 n=1 Tax=Benincasa hispida TaxID=102211 RepID=UPI0019008588|nr:uncharacterized protein LOC120089164 [Benincasa hispida]